MNFLFFMAEIARWCLKFYRDQGSSYTSVLEHVDRALFGSVNDYWQCGYFRPITKVLEQRDLRQQMIIIYYLLKRCLYLGYIPHGTEVGL